ncbi:hypothetical protein ACQ858_08145 [Variovorax ureilyticus]|uniref:hypothetical protein n=1 Tax=Variovorax ureilyticus TaxID=1836198 RepID=UPI003D668FE7
MITNKNTPQEREAFEAWAKSAKAFMTIRKPEEVVSRYPDGRYVFGSVRQAWEAWQARAALAPQAERAAPAERKPLTDEQVAEFQRVIYDASRGDFEATVDEARAIYAAAHGISSGLDRMARNGEPEPDDTPLETGEGDAR